MAGVKRIGQIAVSVSNLSGQLRSTETFSGSSSCFKRRRVWRSLCAGTSD